MNISQYPIIAIMSYLYPLFPSTYPLKDIEENRTSGSLTSSLESSIRFRRNIRLWDNSDRHFHDETWSGLQRVVVVVVIVEVVDSSEGVF